MNNNYPQDRECEQRTLCSHLPTFSALLVGIANELIFFFIFFLKQSHVVQVCLELALYQRLVLNSS